MTPERWRQIEELYHAARARGPAVLAETEPDIRREVERLLAQDSSGKFLDRPAVELVDEFTKTSTAAGGASLTGQTVSHFRIMEPIGAGGMGVVYKAFDTKLGRLVALKFLPPHLSHDSELKRRLSAEARAASALDHPNIVVIHDIDETPSGNLFIAMAFHGGATLRDKAAAGISVREALQITLQISSGLAKAHENGILHRDIKPSNVIVATDGTARIIDFGLARSTDDTVTADGQARGTPLYMSPEQASGKPIDLRTDLWSLGAVLYELLAGKPPFAGETQLQVMHAVVYDDPPKLREIQPAVSPEIDAIVTRALQKDPAKRYSSAAEMGKDLSGALAALDAPVPRRTGLRAIYAIPAAVLILLGAAVSLWLYQRSEKRHWAREQVPGIARLTSQNKTLAALRLFQEVQNYLPGDAQVEQIGQSLTHPVTVRSTPAGATVEIQDYLSPGDPWYSLGTTPMDAAKIPYGYFRWRVAKAGVGEVVQAPIPEDVHGFTHDFNFRLDAQASAPEGMVAVPGGPAYSYVWSIGDLGPYDLPLYYIDRFEVTSRQYQQFVDNGGYGRREYWKEKFLRDGKELSWEQAMDLLRDSSGRPGPSTWAAGHYPAGQDDAPVTGVSWYEASAYAEFAGKSLPAIAQWYQAAPSSIAKYIEPLSNFSSSLAPVGKYQGLGAFGTYDMAGNVAEWCRNEAGGGMRYQLGGAWNTSTSDYFEPGESLPFQRDNGSGFRCVRNTGPLPAEATAERRQTMRDFANAKPANDAVFAIYKGMYSYDHTALNTQPETVPQDSADWHKEKVTIDAAYGKERMAVYLFLPARVQPPYQTVVFFPSARVVDIPSSTTLGDMQFIDYVILSGRAVVYPVYKGTYERPAPMGGPDTAGGRETMFQESKDIGRAIDYLETRTDIDLKRLAYLGDSMGAALGVDFAAVENRFHAVVLLDGGFFIEAPLPGTDQADFAPHIKAPTLLVAGKFDWIFCGKDALLKMIGAPPSDKRVRMLDTPHNVSEQRPEMIHEVLSWLDTYLGRVK